MLQHPTQHRQQQQTSHPHLHNFSVLKNHASAFWSKLSKLKDSYIFIGFGPLLVFQNVHSGVTSQQVEYVVIRLTPEDGHVVFSLHDAVAVGRKTKLKPGSKRNGTQSPTAKSFTTTYPLKSGTTVQPINASSCSATSSPFLSFTVPGLAWLGCGVYTMFSPKICTTRQVYKSCTGCNVCKDM